MAASRGATPEEVQAAVEELHSRLMSEADVRTKFPNLSPRSPEYKRLWDLYYKKEVQRKADEKLARAEREQAIRRRRAGVGMER